MDRLQDVYVASGLGGLQRFVADQISQEPAADRFLKTL
jgi:hypothetical protein